MKSIEITDLCKIYKTKKKGTVEALNNLNLSVAAGQVFGFLGPNGAGKSTTLKILTGQIRPTSGSARILGVPVSIAEARRRVGYLPENPAFYDYMTAREYLRFVGRAFQMDRRAVAVETERVLDLLHLCEAAARPIRSFSKGMVQRLGIAQVLLHNPQVCIFDEPMSGLDPMGRALVKDIIKDLKVQGKTVFFSTHITADVEVVCDQVGVIVDGTLCVVDSVEHILQSGIKGYTVQVIRHDGTTDQLQVEGSQLQEQMQQLWSAGVIVERIEPLRQNLETFFLEVVAKARK